MSEVSNTSTPVKLPWPLENDYVCGYCRWWYATDLSETGECRRLSPRMIHPLEAEELVQDKNMNQMTALRLWPQTFLEDYCGEWQSTPKGPHHE